MNDWMIVWFIIDVIVAIIIYAIVRLHLGKHIYFLCFGKWTMFYGAVLHYDRIWHWRFPYWFPICKVTKRTDRSWLGFKEDNDK